MPSPSEAVRSAVETIRRAGLKLPKTLFLAISGDCNLHCAHCLVESPRPGHVPAADVRRVVEEFLALGGEEICLTGGEPLTRPDWFDLVSFISRQPSVRSLRLQTNATLLTSHHADALRSLRFDGLSFQISLEGGTPATHDEIRGEGAFAAALAGLDHLVESGFGRRITINFTEMRHNMVEIPGLLFLADWFGVKEVVGSTLVSHGRASGSRFQPPLPSQYTDLLERYRHDAEFRKLYDKLGRFSAIEWWLGRNEGPSGCCSFVETLYLTADGLLFPCALLHSEDYAARAAFDRPLAETIAEAVPLWSGLLEDCRQRAETIETCRGCPAKGHCGGGCPARALLVHGDLGCPEDRCELRKAVFGWRPQENFELS
jgi:radical SAM protein with 4Fe4S-binding SPASM domain